MSEDIPSLIQIGQYVLMLKASMAAWTSMLPPFLSGNHDPLSRVNLFDLGSQGAQVVEVLGVRLGHVVCVADEHPFI